MVADVAVLSGPAYMVNDGSGQKCRRRREVERIYTPGVNVCTGYQPKPRVCLHVESADTSCIFAWNKYEDRGLFFF